MTNKPLDPIGLARAASPDVTVGEAAYHQELGKVIGTLRDIPLCDVNRVDAADAVPIAVDLDAGHSGANRCSQVLWARHSWRSPPRRTSPRNSSSLLPDRPSMHATEGCRPPA